MLLPALVIWLAAMRGISVLRRAPRAERFGVLVLPGALLLSATNAWSQDVAGLPVTRDGSRVTAAVQVTSEGQAVEERPVTWTLENAREGDSFAGDTQALTDAKGVASVVLVLGAAQGTRTIVATVSVFRTTPVVVRFNVANDAQAAIDGLTTFITLPQIGLDTALVQMRNVGRRIRERRGGGPAVSIFGTALGPQPGDIRVMSMAQAAEKTAAAVEDPLGGRLGVFLNGQGSFGTRDASANQRGYDTRTIGLTGGVDYRFTASFIFGGALGIVRAKSAFDADYGDASANGVAGSVYGSYYHGKFYVDVIATLGLNRYDTRRAIGGADAQGATDGRQFGGSISAGWTTNRGPLSFGPYVRAGYVQVGVDEFTETGTTGGEMTISSQSATSLTTALGGQASYSISRGWGVLTPSVRVEFEREQRQNVRILTGSLVADPIRTLFAIPSDEPDRSYFNVGAGLAAQFANGRAAFINYEGMFGRSQITNHAVIVGGRLEF